VTLEELERALLVRAPADRADSERWKGAVKRVIAAARPPEHFDEIADRLPPKPRYIGPGPWLDAVKDSWRR
jgi:hypothetical protein